MYSLYHHPLCPFSRKIRFFLTQKGLEFKLIKENFWERRKEFLAVNPAATVPVLYDHNNRNIIASSQVIIEYIEEKHDNSYGYIGGSLSARAKSRFIQNWFDEKFWKEAGKNILNERYFNRYILSDATPNPENLRIAKYNLNIHLNYIEHLLQNSKYLAGEQITIADFAAAGHISVLDYFGDINWSNYLIAKEWYAIVKSQKGFFPILKERITGITPSDCYGKLDF